MKNLSPTILALAALAPTAAALDVKDDDVKLGLYLQLQVRAERGWSRDTTGNPYNIAESAANTRPDNADFYLRRFRIGFKGTYKDDYKFIATVRMDNADRTGDASPSTTATGAPAGTNLVTATNGDPLNRVPQINQAVVERVFKGENVEQSIRAGLDYAFFNGALAVFSSSSYLFPSDRVTTNSAFLAPRGVGVGYKLSGKVGGIPYTWGADVQNNIADDSAAVTGNTGAATYNQRGEGLVYTTRLQFIPYDSEAKGHIKPTESFVGAPGTGVLASIEYGINRNNNVTATTRQNLHAAGTEILIHKDGLTALAEYRIAILHTDASTAVNDKSQGSRAFIIQAGYAIPAGSTWVEPAFRWTRINFDRAFSENQAYGSQSGSGVDYGSSGFQTELGVNWYLNKHSNKLQFAYQNWRGEGASSAGVGPAQSDKVASANVVRAQWQLTF